MPTNSSGRLPRVDCSRPVAPGPEPLADLLDGLPDQGGQGGQGQAGQDEADDRAGPTAAATPAAAVSTTAAPRVTQWCVSR